MSASFWASPACAEVASWGAPAHPVRAYGWAEAIGEGGEAVAVVAVARLEVEAAGCGREGWPQCHRWVAWTVVGGETREAVLVDSDTPSGMEVEALEGGGAGALVVWREGVYVGDEGRVVATWVGADGAHGGEVTLWRGEEGRAGRAAVAHVGTDTFWACWTEARGRGGAVMCQEVQPLAGMATGPALEAVRSEAPISALALASVEGGQATLVWVEGERLGGCAWAGGRCWEARWGAEGVAAGRLVVEAGFGGALVLWVGTDGQWLGQLWRDGAPTGAARPVGGDGSLQGVAVGADGFWIARAWGAQAKEGEPVTEPQPRTGLWWWPARDGEGAWIPEVAGLPRFSLSRRGALSVGVDTDKGRHHLAWTPWPAVEAPLRGPRPRSP